MPGWARVLVGWAGILTVVLGYVGRRLRRRLYPGFSYLTVREAYSWSAIRGRLTAYVVEVWRILREEQLARFVIVAVVALAVAAIGGLAVEPSSHVDSGWFWWLVRMPLGLIVLAAVVIAPLSLLGGALKYSWSRNAPIPVRESLPERIQRLTQTLDVSLTTLAALEQEIARRRKAISEIEEREALAGLSERERAAVARQLEFELRRAGRTAFLQNAFFFVLGLAASWLLQRLT
jgi:hypothetical protein